jgi:hypothetical protein
LREISQSVVLPFPHPGFVAPLVNSVATTPSSPALAIDAAPVCEADVPVVQQNAGFGREGFKMWLARGAAAVVVVAALLAVGWKVRAYWLTAAEASRTGIEVFESAPSGSQVVIDGVTTGNTPLTAALSPGKHTVEFRFREASRVFKIDTVRRGRSLHRVDVTGGTPGAGLR